MRILKSCCAEETCLGIVPVGQMLDRVSFTVASTDLLKIPFKSNILHSSSREFVLSGVFFYNHNKKGMCAHHLVQPPPQAEPASKLDQVA